LKINSFGYCIQELRDITATEGAKGKPLLPLLAAPIGIQYGLCIILTYMKLLANRNERLNA